MKFFIPIMIFTTILTGCANFEIPDTSLQDGNIMGASKIEAKDVLINKPYNDIQRVEFVVLVANSNTDYNAYNNFMKIMLERIGFKNILSETEFSQLIIEKEIATAYVSTYDLVFLHKISNELGPFIVIDTTLRNIANSSWFDNQLKIINPEKPETLVRTHVRKSNFRGLDLGFNYPTINLINDWYKASRKPPYSIDD